MDGVRAPQLAFTLRTLLGQDVTAERMVTLEAT